VTDVPSTLAALASFDRPTLASHWVKAFGVPAPKSTTGLGALRLGAERLAVAFPARVARVAEAVFLGRGLDRVDLVVMSISWVHRARWRRDQ
jgi:hypothetical protein